MWTGGEECSGSHVPAAKIGKDHGRRCHGPPSSSNTCRTMIIPPIIMAHHHSPTTTVEPFESQSFRNILYISVVIHHHHRLAVGVGGTAPHGDFFHSRAATIVRQAAARHAPPSVVRSIATGCDVIHLDMRIR